ncbi:hypothetical protein LXA43DRAFT_513498 [Ganoderma leucocontextum]|nr:hypothetical protein LXA43DRAFT_513498 [Ganoderma leucocontextum]
MYLCSHGYKNGHPAYGPWIRSYHDRGRPRRQSVTPRAFRQAWSRVPKQCCQIPPRQDPEHAQLALGIESFATTAHAFAEALADVLRSGRRVQAVVKRKSEYMSLGRKQASQWYHVGCPLATLGVSAGQDDLFDRDRDAETVCLAIAILRRRDCPDYGMGPMQSLGREGHSLGYGFWSGRPHLDLYLLLVPWAGMPGGHPFLTLTFNSESHRVWYIADRTVVYDRLETDTMGCRVAFLSNANPVPANDMSSPATDNSALVRGQQHGSDYSRRSLRTSVALPVRDAQCRDRRPNTKVS